MHYLQRSAAPSMTASYIATVRVYVSRVMVRVSPVARYSGLSMIQGIIQTTNLPTSPRGTLLDIHAFSHCLLTV